MHERNASCWILGPEVDRGLRLVSAFQLSEETPFRLAGARGNAQEARTQACISTHVEVPLCRVRLPPTIGITMGDIMRRETICWKLVEVIEVKVRDTRCHQRPASAGGWWMPCRCLHWQPDMEQPGASAPMGPMCERRSALRTDQESPGPAIHSHRNRYLAQAVRRSVRWLRHGASGARSGAQ